MSRAQSAESDTANMSGRSPMVELLRKFNRKERYWLLSEALGSDIPLSPDYRRRIECLIGKYVPEDAWWALDYHFDWLYAVLSCAPDFNPSLPRRPVPNGKKDKRTWPITGSQEDIDFLIAFGTTLILVEAKAATGWTHRQMASKAERLASLAPFLAPPVSGDATDPTGIRIYFVLTSPKESAALRKGSSEEKNGDWIKKIPSSMQCKASEGGDYCYFLKLEGFYKQKFFQVERCDSDEKSRHDGGHWHIIGA